MTDKPKPTTVQLTTTWVHLGIFIGGIAFLGAMSLGYLDSKFDAVDARLDAVDARFEAVDTRFNAVDRRLDTLETDIRALTGRVTDLSARVARIEGHLQTAADDNEGADAVAQQ